MTQQQIFITGGHGLVGSRIIQLLSDQFECIAPHSSKLDITDQKAVETAIEAFVGDWIIHAAAYTDVDGCEQHQDKARSINIDGTAALVTAARKYDKKVLFVSTDFVFDGTASFYDEQSVPSPISFYGVTKYAGEKLVGAYSKNLIVRISFPYGRSISGVKKDFVAAIRNQLAQGKNVVAPDDNLFTPTFIDDIAQALRVLIIKNESGIYHVVGNSTLSSYRAAQAIAQNFHYQLDLVQPTKHRVYYENRAKRPLHLTTKNDKIASLGVPMKTFEEGLEIIASSV